jgi:hypothetical protein
MLSRSLPFLAVYLLLFGCGHVPLTSLVKLSRINFETSDPAQLRAAVKLPLALRPLPRGVVLRIVARSGDSQEETRDFVLHELPEPAELVPETSSDTRVYAYRLEDADLARLTAFRSELMARKSVGRGGAVSISVQPRACKTAELPDGPVCFTAYLRTAETIDYVTLARDVDLRSLAPGRAVIDEISRCEP